MRLIVLLLLVSGLNQAGPVMGQAKRDRQQEQGVEHASPSEDPITTVEPAASQPPKAAESGQAAERPQQITIVDNRSNFLGWAGLVVNFFLILLVGYQARTYKGQLDAMEAGLTETRKLVRQNERAIVAAEKSAKISQDAYYIGQRAYVYMESIKLVKIEITAPIAVDFVLFNAGSTPARETHTTAEIILAEPTHAPTPHVQKPEFIKGRGVFIPAGRRHEATIVFDQTAEEADIQAIARDELTFFVVGTISYQTIQNEVVSESFCSRWNSEAQRFEHCERDDSREI